MMELNYKDDKSFHIRRKTLKPGEVTNKREYEVVTVEDGFVTQIEPYSKVTPYLETDKIILDVCCGSKMFWFDKNHKNTIFMDNRKIETTLCDGRTLKVSPDVIGDFKNIPFPDNNFKIVIFDPPHLIHAGEKSWLRRKYGCLDKDTWKEDIKLGFNECMRVLEKNGILIFKWNEDQIKLKDLLKAIEYTPLIGDKRSKTHWLIFIK